MALRAYWIAFVSCVSLTHVCGFSVGVIGSGIGGAAAAYFVRELLGSGAEIAVFEASPQTGGRTDHFVYDNVSYETGASIIYSGNVHFANLTDQMGLHRIPPRHAEGGGLGLWNGKKFATVTGQTKFVNIMKMAWRYKRSLFTVRSVVMHFLAKFEDIYALQAEGKFFLSAEELWDRLGLLDLTKVTIQDFIRGAVGRNNTLIEKELVFAVNRVNYNQDNSLNALAGLVSLCPLITGDIFQVEEGNSKLSEELVKAAGAHLRLDTRVTAVAGPSPPSAGGGYSVMAGQEKLGQFDAVLVAAPLALAGISFDVRWRSGESLPRPSLPRVEFQSTHATFVKGVVNREYFGGRVPYGVLLTEEGGAAEGFSSLALHTALGDGPHGTVGIYKLFSSQELWTGLLDKLFVPGTWEVLHHRAWQAYPKLQPLQGFAPVVLYEGHPIFYLNALEEAVSALEISAISAKNVALAVAQAARDLGWPRAGGAAASAAARLHEADVAAGVGAAQAGGGPSGDEL